MSAGNTTWMVSPKSCIKLLGAEYDLMRDAGVLKRFYISSVSILVIMALTWISVEYAIDLLFHTIAIEIALAIFFCLLFVCIYIFLLNTFTKENSVRRGILNLSNIIRLGFIAFMGFLIAQPLVVMLYASKLAPSIENYKQYLIKTHSTKINALMEDEITNLVTRQHYYTIQKKMFGTHIYDEQLNKIDQTIKQMQEKEESFKLAALQTIDYNSFFLYRVQKVNREYPFSWLLTLLIILLFLLPGYLIYTISNQHEYYRLKKDQEKKLVLEAYSFFTNRYKALFNEQVSIFTRYQDPPFNTIRKQPAAPASMAAFLQKYLDN
jgi:hypothetical protein